MNSDDLEDDIIVSIIGLIYIRQKCLKRKRPKSIWVNPYLKSRREKGRYFTAMKDMRENPMYFKENFHMMPEQFDSLVTLTRPYLQAKVNTRPHDGISPEEKLAVTLEYLASGSLQRHIASIYRISKQRVGFIIENTCQAIYTALKAVTLKAVTSLATQDWLRISNDYHSHWNFPHCLGSIDGKHVALKCPKNAASCFYNYKGFHSIVLLAAVDANYKFIYVDIGAYGSEGDSSVFQKSQLGNYIVEEQLKFPPNMKIKDKLLPFFFVADDAFPLDRRIMKPYKPTVRRGPLTEQQRIFNYRLSRARRCVENAFGILCCKWIVLARTMFVNPDRAQKIVAACCALHNYLISTSDDTYAPPNFADSLNDDGEIVEGSWRQSIPQNSMYHNRIDVTPNERSTKAALDIRDNLKIYVNSPEGSVKWQRSAIFI